MSEVRDVHESKPVVALNQGETMNKVTIDTLVTQVPIGKGMSAEAAESEILPVAISAMKKRIDQDRPGWTFNEADVKFSLMEVPAIVDVAMAGVTERPEGDDLGARLWDAIHNIDTWRAVVEVRPGE